MSAPVGILMLDTSFQRVPGDIGNTASFSHSVAYRRVEGATSQRVVEGRAAGLLEPFAQAAEALAEDNAQLITTSCGFLACFQRELADRVAPLVATSSLLLVPLVAALLAPMCKVGILTFDAASLTPAHFSAVGIDPTTVLCASPPPNSAFRRAISENWPEFPKAQAEAELVDLARNFVGANPAVKALVLECTNMPPYGQAISQAAGVPVFDILHLVSWAGWSQPDAVSSGAA